MKDHLLDNLLGDIKKGVSIHFKVNNLCNYSIFISQIGPKYIIAALTNEGWLISMQEKLTQFKQSDMGDLVIRSQNKIVIGTR